MSKKLLHEYRKKNFFDYKRPYNKIKHCSVIRKKDNVEFMVVGRFNPILRHDPKCGKYHLKDLNIPAEHVWVSYYKLRKYYA